jgi:hypothetical protein
VFGTDRYFPGKHATRGILAHELAHVVQQRGLWANTTSGSPSSRRPLSQGAAASELTIQRTDGSEAPASVPDEAPSPSTWIISEQFDSGKIRDPSRGFAPAANRQPIPPGTTVSPLDYKEVSDYLRLGGVARRY